MIEQEKGFILNGLTIISKWDFVRKRYLGDINEEDINELLITVDSKKFIILSESFQESDYWQERLKPIYEKTEKSLGWLINSLEHKSDSRYFHLISPIPLQQLKQILIEFIELIE
jgi:hypothetical protein